MAGFKKLDETGNSVPGRNEAETNRMLGELFDGGGVGTKAEIAALTAIATADATDEASAVTLANATKAKVNAIIAALKA